MTHARESFRLGVFTEPAGERRFAPPACFPASTESESNFWPPKLEGYEGGTSQISLLRAGSDDIDLEMHLSYPYDHIALCIEVTSTLRAGDRNYLSWLEKRNIEWIGRLYDLVK